jgi:5-oxoprolinase (ATP-hydrolysing)
VEIIVEEVRLGTTVATNALLERQGEPTVLVTNQGFGDALVIGYQNRPDIFALNIDRPPPLFSEVIELDCRFDKNGRVLSPFPAPLARKKLQSAFNEKGIRSAAIVFMHGYKYPEHEVTCANIARELGFSQVSMSHCSSGLIRFVSRGDTTLIDAYLTPPLQKYIDDVCKDLKNTPVLFMKSDGGLAGRAVFSGKDAILSGPAGGVVGAVAVAAKNNPTGQMQSSIVGFDMGGTSTDVCYWEGSYERQMECTISGVRLRVPMLAVHTVAAGGGSILTFDGARFLVGPHSARAVPGPACYGLDGPATVSDANLILGRLSLQDFPHVFGPSADQPLNIEASKKRLAAIASQIIQAAGTQTMTSYDSVEQIAEGFLTVATEKMAQAIAKVSIQKGHDVRNATLVAFGGAGGQHACMIAERLGIKTILLSPLAGVLSAYGIGASETSDTKQLTIRESLSAALLTELEQRFEQLTHLTREAIDRAGTKAAKIESRFQLGLSYKGSDTTILIDYDPIKDDCAVLGDRFKDKHKKLFGFVFEDNDIIAESMLVESRTSSNGQALLMGATAFQGENPRAKNDTGDGHLQGRPWTIFSRGKLRPAQLYKRQELSYGDVICGPALIAEPTSTSVIEDGWSTSVLADGCLLVRKNENEVALPAASGQSSVVDPVQLELFNNIFMTIAEEMGITLQKVSHSVNIKERLDFSCAIFDDQGRLIANAPHIPVHLGSMGDSVASLLRSHRGKLKEGEAYVLNNPYNGGTHLPDITVISPVFGPASADTGVKELLFFVGSRGHHADIGGITPGSMPAGSRNIEEEGVLIDNFRVLSGGQFLQQDFAALLAGAKYPARNITQNIKDLKAQIAANARGQEGLCQAIERYGLATVRAYMDHVRENAAKSIRDLLKRLKSGRASCTMDDGSTIAVSITVDQKNAKAVIDFTGTSDQTDNNLNAPLAVTRAAVLYVFRTLAETSIPLNDGCSEPLTLTVPEGCMLNPKYPHAVVAGNVETSQVIVDTLYQALGALAGSQGTMNNFTFGDDTHQYYETIAGGSGAGDGFAGTDAVQTHMTNSRLTDPEVLEERFPVLLEEFSIRKNSGGQGKYRGGCGARRKIRFLTAMSASILSNRRKTSAPGLAGGGPGAPGANYLVKANGEMIALASTETVDVEAGQSILIETPGGGAFGPN